MAVMEDNISSNLSTVLVLTPLPRSSWRMVVMIVMRMVTSEHLVSILPTVALVSTQDSIKHSPSLLSRVSRVSRLGAVVRLVSTATSVADWAAGTTPRVTATTAAASV